MVNWGVLLKANVLPPMTSMGFDQAVPSNPASLRLGWKFVVLSQSRKAVWESSSYSTEGELSTSGPPVPVAAHPAALDRPVAEAYYGDALALASTLGLRPAAARCHLGLGTLHLRAGRRAEARQHLSAATTMFREMDMRFWLEQAEVAMRDLADN